MSISLFIGDMVSYISNTVVEGVKLPIRTDGAEHEIWPFRFPDMQFIRA